MRSIFFVFLFSIFLSCQKEAPKVAMNDGTSSKSPSSNFDFDKKEKEGCDTENDLAKKIEEMKKKEAAAKKSGGGLLEGVTGCDTSDGASK